jgi:hypothetical protein
MLLNGFEVLCERYGGHPDQHENYTLSAPATMCWDDQPECWED